MSHLDDAQREALAAGEGVGPEAAAHLASCAACEAAVRDAKGRRALLGGLRDYTLSDVAFRRVEARLVEQVEAGLERRPPWLAWLAGAAAVAVAAVAILAPWSGGSASHDVALPALVASPALEAFPSLTVLRAAPGSQVRSDDGDWRPLPAGAQVEQGDVLSSNGVSLAPAGPLAWAFDARGVLALGGAVTVDLGEGQVVAEVDAPASVGAGARRVHATQALFSVNRAAGEVMVSVARGSVEVEDTGTAERRRLDAPATLRWAESAALGSAVAEPFAPVTAPAVPAKPWAHLDLTGLPAGTGISLDGAALGEAPLDLLAAVGRRRLGLTPPGGALVETWVELSAAQPFMATLPDAEGAPAPPREALARVQAALERQRPRLAVCYEAWLKANPTAGGQSELVLVLAPDGRVKQARLRGGGLPTASAECLTRTAKRLTLPSLGSEVELEVPLVFTTGR